jgi:CRP/FNR family transcriptional regulator
MQSTDNVIRLSQGEGHCQSCRLRRLCVMGALTDAEVSRAIHACRPVARNHYIFRQGDAARSLFLLKGGSAKSFVVAEDGSEQIERFQLPGDVLGLESLQGRNYSVSALALEHATLCEMPMSEIAKLCQRNSNLLERLLGELGNLLVEDTQLRLLVSQRNAEARLATFLLDIIAHWKHRQLSIDTITLPMSRYDIGNYLGIASETVSRILSRFEARSLIKVDRKRLDIKDLDGLNHVAASAGDHSSTHFEAG